MTVKMWLVLKAFVNMVAFVSLYIIDPSAFALRGSPGPDAKSMSMNALQHPATMVEPVWICLKDTDVNVLKASVDFNVMKRNQTVTTIPVLTGRCAKTSLALATTLACASLATLARAVTSLWILVRLILASMAPSVRAINRDVLAVFVLMDGKVLSAIKTLMTVLKILACSLPIVRI
jgi:hypothetical protein